MHLYQIRIKRRVVEGEGDSTPTTSQWHSQIDGFLASWFGGCPPLLFSASALALLPNCEPGQAKHWVTVVCAAPTVKHGPLSGRANDTPSSSRLSAAHSHVCGLGCREHCKDQTSGRTSLFCVVLVVDVARTSYILRRSCSSLSPREERPSLLHPVHLVRRRPIPRISRR